MLVRDLTASLADMTESALGDAGRVCAIVYVKHEVAVI